MNRFIKLNRCDSFSKMSTHDVFELINKLKKFKLQYRRDIKIPCDITFGIEIEFENAEFEKVKEYLKEEKPDWKIVREECIQQIKDEKLLGGEVVSPILRNKANYWQDIKDLCLKLKELQAKTSGYTAGHIHIGTNIIGENKLYWYNLIKLWTLYEHVIYRFGYGTDKKERDAILDYAPPVASDFKKKISLIGKYVNDDQVNYIDFLKKVILSDYHGIHFFDVGRLNKDTIEVKCPNGTVEELIWQNNINFFTKFIKFATKVDPYLFDKKLDNHNIKSFDSYNYINLKDALDLVDLVFDNNYDKVCFLKQYLKVTSPKILRKKDIF